MKAELFAIWLKESDKNIVDLFTDITTPCIIDRLLSIYKSSVEYDLEFHLGTEEEAKSGRVKYEKFAINYGYIRPRLIIKRAIVDKVNRLMYEINVNEKILVKQKPINIFYDTDKASQYGTYLYDGSLEEALKEFRTRGFEIVDAGIIL